MPSITAPSQNVHPFAHELARLPLFQGEPAAELEWLVPMCGVEQRPEGLVLLTPEHFDDQAFVVLEGAVRVQLDAAGERSVALLGAGQCVGEMSVIEGLAPSATVVTATECRLLRIEGPALRTAVEVSNTVARNLLRILSRRLRHDNLLVSRTLEQQDELQSHANRDALTGLYNRRWFDGALAAVVDHQRARGGRLSLLMVDIDRFKRVNDTHGHASGDRALCTVAEVLRTEIRASDHAARLGGEEFAVLLPHTAGDEAAQIAERIRHAVRQQPIVDPDGASLPPVTVSIGVAEAGPDETDRRLLARADAALYRAKRAGRDRVMC